MSNTNRGRGMAGRGMDDDTRPVLPSRARGRGRMPSQDDSAGRSGREGRETGPPSRGGGARNNPIRGGWNNPTRQGDGGPPQGGARAAAAAYESQRRQRAAEERARIQAGRSNAQTQQRGDILPAAFSSQKRQTRTPVQPSSDTSGLAPGRTITARGTQKPKDKGKAHPAITNYDDEDDGNDAQSHTDSKAPVRRKGTSLPVDLPTTYYEALRLADAPSAYINYPARIHHLKYPAEESTPSVGHKWEDIHLHQKVSSPRLDTRWTRPATAADIERSRDFFVRFHAAGYEPFMGFRPYTDILFLDGQYMAAVLSRCRPNAATPEHDADSLVPFLTTSDRVKVRILAVAASAFGYAQRARVCAALVRAFPSLARVFLVSVATVPRPLSAAWDLETEFARWIRMSEAAQVEAQRTEEVVGGVGAYGVEHGLLEEEDGSGGSPLAEELEASFVLARESGRRTADNRAQAEQDLEKKREPVDWDKVDYRKMLHPRTSTSDRSTGSSRSSGVTRKVQVEAYIMLYFQDAFDRAVSNGLSEELDRTSVKYLNLDMK